MYPVYSKGFVIEAKGRLGNDIEYKKHDDKYIISFSIAVDVGSKKVGENYENITNWLKFVIWVNPAPKGEDAERIDVSFGLFKFLVRCKKDPEVKTAFKKGHLINVKALVQQKVSVYEDKNGETKASIEYTVNKLYDLSKILLPTNVSSSSSKEDDDDVIDGFDNDDDDEDFGYPPY